MGDTDRSDLADRLRHVDSLLTAATDMLSSLHRVLAEVHRELGPARREEEERPRDAEIAQLRHEVEQLREGMASRAVIERAKGVIMRGHGVSEAESFALLTDLSQRTHRKVRDVAADLLDGPPDLQLVGSRPETVPAARSRNGRNGDTAVRTLVTSGDSTDPAGSP
ncbi:ANTAR domain-containing protein [Modestobacter muralis]|uniref:ANTAR domain-containing protein n=1 Tax=Modestobacter muralis TaxID=1608614 RepID=A0A6P0H9T0_9ACTN|nr:ANTAR domain-containing protein [Modestobacter muralis]NEK95663.1 ANTAR domain-containing protein [Modestobacter muralis]NEN52551.1 ANTAR domain-containing protein [Modestobacter muralis]